MTRKYTNEETVKQLQKELLLRQPLDLEELLVARETYNSLWSLTPFEERPLEKESKFIATFTQRHYDDGEGNSLFIRCCYGSKTRLYATFENYFELFFPTKKFQSYLLSTQQGNLRILFKDILKDVDLYLGYSIPEENIIYLCEYVAKSPDWVARLIQERNRKTSFIVDADYNYIVTDKSIFDHEAPDISVHLLAEESAQIRKNLKNYPNSFISDKNLIYCKTQCIINEWEYNFYKTIKIKKVNLSEKQSAMKLKIHNKVIKEI